MKGTNPPRSLFRGHHDIARFLTLELGAAISPYNTGAGIGDTSARTCRCAPVLHRYVPANNDFSASYASLVGGERKVFDNRGSNHRNVVAFTFHAVDCCDVFCYSSRYMKGKE